MRKREIHTTQQIIVWLSTFVILFQIGVEPPVICFESDGQINIETRCDSICEIPAQEMDEDQNDCEDCFDINLWNYDPDVVLIIQDTNFDEVISFASIFLVSIDEETKRKNQFQATQNFSSKIPPLIKTTRLLI